MELIDQRRAFAVRTHEVWKKKKGPTKNQTSSPTAWLRMHVWRMSLRKMKSAIISWHGLIEPSPEKTDLSVMLCEIPQMRLHSLWKGSKVRLFAWSFLYIPILREPTVKALARLRGCAGLPEPLLVAYVISTFFTRAGSNLESKRPLFYRNDSKFSDRQIWANSADPDQTAPRGEEQSDQGLHWLQFPLHLLDALL